MLVFDHALGVEDRAVIDDVPVDEGQPYANLQVAPAHQPRQGPPRERRPLTTRSTPSKGRVER